MHQVVRWGEWIGESEENVTTPQLQICTPGDNENNVLVNETILKNCSKHLPREAVNKHLQYVVKRMQYSGYPQEHRYEVLLRTFKNDEAKEIRGAGVVTRTRKKGRDWYDWSTFDVTPNGEFKHKVQDAFKRTEVKVKVIERMNRTVKNQIHRNNPLKPALKSLH